jgi:hypothetical protein
VPAGPNLYAVRQQSNGRYVDAHEGINDNLVVTRESQGNATQVWRITPIGGNRYTIQQLSNGRFLDAYENEKDNRVVTRNAQNNDTQRWILIKQN